MTTQLDASIGIKKETTYGTAVTVDNFVEFLTESLDRQATYAQGNPLRAGSRTPRAARRQLAAEGAAGAIGLEAQIRGLGVFFEAVLGAVTNTGVPSATGAYQQVHTPATTDPMPSYTIQKGIPPLGGGATHPYTFVGAMCRSLEVKVAEAATVEITTEWIAKNVSTGEAYAAPSYATGTDVLTYMSGTLVHGGTLTAPTSTALASVSGGTTAANVVDVSVKYENGLDDGGRSLGAAGQVSRKPVLGRNTITGSMTVEYTDTTLRDAYLNQTDLAFVLTMSHPTITIGTGTPVAPVLQIVIPVINLEGEIPKANGGEPVRTTVGFTGLDGESASAPIYVVYRTADTTV